eukprot:9466313-Pyramimonas_sp.AAC.1
MCCSRSGVRSGGVPAPAGEPARPRDEVADPAAVMSELLREEGIDPLEAASAPPFAADDLRRVARTFKPRAAVGAGKLSPRDLCWLAGQCLTVLGLLWHWMLDTWKLSSQSPLIMIAMLEKPEGGFRPIGLLTTFVTVWGRCARSVARHWGNAKKRAFIYGRAGMSCERGAREQAFAAERALPANSCLGEGLLDLSEAYERVLHGWLIDAARAWKFPLGILRILIAIYRGPRLL